MLKRTLFFVTDYHLSVKNRQLAVKDKASGSERIVPAEDIGFVILDNSRLSYTHSVLQLFSRHNIAVLICDEKRMPASMLLNFESNHLTGRITERQLQASEPLKKQLWKQTVKTKIRNQAAVLQALGKDSEALLQIAKEVKSGDVGNQEGRAAKLYWQRLFPNFTRHPDGENPNSLFNYAYTILRAATAKSLVSSGLLPVLGIHHHNKYNAFRLADDVMEPYRPYADFLVCETYRKFPNYTDLTPEIKSELLGVLFMDTHFAKVTRPLSLGLSISTASLAQCFTGECQKIRYPNFCT